MLLRFIITVSFGILCGCTNSSEKPQKSTVVDNKQHGLVTPDVGKKQDGLSHGTWTCIAMEVSGEKYIKMAFEGMTLKTDGENWAITHFGTTSKIKVKLDQAKDPWEVDMFYEWAGDDASPLKGIFKLEGDKLTLCRALGNGSRPKEFQTNVQGSTMMVFQRLDR